MYEPVEDCVEFYSECNFEGKKFEICRDTPSFSNAKINQAIQSIKIPPGVIVDGFKDEQYRGGKVTFTESQKCIIEYDFSLFQMTHKT
jgi:hypothetical protein